MILTALMEGPSMCVASVPISCHDNESAISAISAALERDDQQLVVVSVNLDHYSFLDKYNVSIRSSPTDSRYWMNLLDGRPIAAAIRMIVGREVEVLPGSDLLPDLLRLCAESGRSVGFCGGTSEMLSDLQLKLDANLHHLSVVGMWAPSRFQLCTKNESVVLAREIEQSGLDLLVLGLGKPLQECWAAEYGLMTGAKVIVCFGAAAEFYAGYQKRAPRLMQNLSMEWLHRLACNPRRMWSRYLVRGPSSMVRILVGLLRAKYAMRAGA